MLKVERQAATGDPMVRFEEALKSKSAITQDQYRRNVLKFLAYAEVADPKELLTEEASNLEAVIMRYISGIRDKRLSMSAQSLAMNSIRFFCLKNKLQVDWDAIGDCRKDPETSKEDKPYTTEQIRLMLDGGQLREKALVHFMAACGGRPGVLPEARVKDLERIDLDEETYLYKFTGYSNSKKARYSTFLTPESSRALDAYFEWRKQFGENMTGDSFIFVKNFRKIARKTKEGTLTPPRFMPLKRSAINQIMTSILVKCGIRSIAPGSRERKENALYYAFRKRWDTIAINSHVYPVTKEKLFAHKVDLDENYSRQTDDDLLREYKKMIPSLTVSNEERLQKENARLVLENSDMSLLKAHMAQQDARIEEQGAMIDYLSKTGQFAEPKNGKDAAT